MTLRYVKVNTREGYSFTPSGAKIAHIAYDSSDIVDMSKSYLDLSVTVEASDSAGNPIEITPLALASKLGSVPFSASSIFRNVKHYSTKNPTYYEEVRDSNVFTNNLNYLTDSIEDSRRKALLGDGFTWSDDHLQVASPFFKGNNFGGGDSQVTTGNLIVPMKDLFFDVGSNQFWPAPLLGTCEMELQIEDTKRIFCGIGISETDLNREGYRVLTGNLAAERAANSDNIITLSHLLETRIQGGALIASPISLSAGITDDQATRILKLYKGMVTQLYLGSAGNGRIAVEITGASRSDGTGVDIFGATPTAGELLLNFKNIDAIPAKDYSGEVWQIFQTPEVHSVTYTVNKIDFVMCERLFSSSEKQKILKTVAEKGMKYNTVLSEGYVVDATTSRFEKQFEIHPNTYCAMIAHTLQGVPAIAAVGTDVLSDNQLLSSNPDLLSYRVQLNNIDTVNRDVHFDESQQTFQVYLHKLENGVKRLGKVMKNKEMFLDYKFNNGLYVRPMQGAATEGYYNAIMEPIDKRPALQTLKLSLNKGTSHNLTGTMFKFVERTLSF